MDMRIDPQLVRAEREKRAWSQEHLAKVAGLGLRTIQRIETTGFASYESVKAIASVLELSVADLRVEDTAPPSRPPHQGPRKTGSGDTGRYRKLVPELVLATAVLGATVIADQASLPFWWAGPLLMASAIVLAGRLQDVIRSSGTSSVRRATVLAVSYLLATILVANTDLAWATMMIPILGGASAVVLAGSSVCLRRRRQAGA